MVTMPERRCTAQEWCYAYEQLSGQTYAYSQPGYLTAGMKKWPT